MGRKVDNGNIIIVDDISLAEKKEEVKTENNDVQVETTNTEEAPSATLGTASVDVPISPTNFEVPSASIAPAAFDSIINPTSNSTNSFSVTPSVNIPQPTLDTPVNSFGTPDFNVASFSNGTMNYGQPYGMDNSAMMGNTTSEALSVYKSTADVKASSVTLLNEINQLIEKNITMPTQVAVEIANEAMAIVDDILKLGGINIEIFNRYKALRNKYEGIKDDEFGKDNVSSYGDDNNYLNSESEEKTSVPIF